MTVDLISPNDPGRTRIIDTLSPKGRLGTLSSGTGPKTGPETGA